MTAAKRRASSSATCGTDEYQQYQHQRQQQQHHNHHNNTNNSSNSSNNNNNNYNHQQHQTYSQYQQQHQQQQSQHHQQSTHHQHNQQHQQQQQQHQHQHQQQQPSLRDCSVKLPLDILWLPKSAMRPVGPETSHTDCILVVGVFRPKLAVVFLTVMLISLFLTFHVLYDSAVYNIQAAQAVSEHHRLNGLGSATGAAGGNRLSGYVFKPTNAGRGIAGGGNRASAIASANQINHPMVFPSNRVHFPKTSRRLPQALIIGIRKCGTRALLEMLYLHPRIQKAGGEVHFFDRDENYLKGLEWYRKKMPHSFRGQITIEKSPSYFVSPEVPERVRAMNASIKLLLIVREPVTRAISDYTQLRSHAATATLPLADAALPAPQVEMAVPHNKLMPATQVQQQQQQQLKHSLLYGKLSSGIGTGAGMYSSSSQSNDNSIGSGSAGATATGKSWPYQSGFIGSGGGGGGGDGRRGVGVGSGSGAIEYYTTTTMPTPSNSAAAAAAALAAAQMASKSFEELAIFPNGTVNESYRPLTISMYHLHLHRWLEVFPREQLLIVNGDRLIEDPVSQLKRIETFLGIEHRVTSSHFYFNETKGFYCLRYDNGDRCLRETKGRKHPHVDPMVISKLRKFFAEHNQRFYELIGEDMGWPEE